MRDDNSISVQRWEEGVVSSVDEPLADECAVALVYNGEVYNYRALMKEAEAAGASFKTTCDTELVAGRRATFVANAYEVVDTYRQGETP